MRRLLEFIFPGRRKRYGGYEFIEQVGRGGMSRIWKARQPGTGRICALKILTPQSVEMMDTFKRVFEAEEGAIALQLDHPNVIKTFDYGRTGKDEYYIAMEFVEGPNLETLVALADPWVKEHRFDLVLQMGAGLTYIHEQGLIHRDFCPKNVLCAKDGTAKITDFGLTIPASVKARTVLSRGGTASYMAPEQVKSRPVDERADIYAFGVSVFEVLSGRRPFPSSPDRSRTMQDHLNVEPLRLREVAPDMPAALEELAQKCIAKDRDLRYKSMRQVMLEFRSAVELARSRRKAAPPNRAPEAGAAQ